MIVGQRLLMVPLHGGKDPEVLLDTRSEPGVAAREGERAVERAASRRQVAALKGEPRDHVEGLSGELALPRRQRHVVGAPRELTGPRRRASLMVEQGQLAQSDRESDPVAGGIGQPAGGFVRRLRGGQIAGALLLQPLLEPRGGVFGRCRRRGQSRFHPASLPGGRSAAPRRPQQPITRRSRSARSVRCPRRPCRPTSGRWTAAARGSDCPGRDRPRRNRRRSDERSPYTRA